MLLKTLISLSEANASSKELSIESLRDFFINEALKELSFKRADWYKKYGNEEEFPDWDKTSLEDEYENQIDLIVEQLKYVKKPTKDMYQKYLNDHTV